MSLTAILIIAGCAVAGYWIVSSVMGSGIDLIDEGRKASARDKPGAAADAERQRVPVPEPRDGLRTSTRRDDWHIVLDVSPDATRAEIQSALKRRLEQAQAVGDAAGAERIRRAAEAGMAREPRG